MSATGESAASLTPTSADDSVRIDVDELLGDAERVEQEAKIQTEQDLLDAIQAERSAKPRKRNNESTPNARPRKRAKPDPAIVGEEESPATGEEQTMMSINPVAVTGMEQKKKTIPLEKKPKTPSITARPTVFPCVLCPDLSTDRLLGVFDPPEHVLASCKSHDGVVRAHEDCAISVPEVYIGDVESEGRTFPMVIGVNDIDKARWGLVCSVRSSQGCLLTSQKCQSCNDKKLASMGAKIQCVNVSFRIKNSARQLT